MFETNYNFNYDAHTGAAVVIPPELQEEADQRFKENEFNVVASEMMSVNRTLADNRHPQ